MPSSFEFLYRAVPLVACYTGKWYHEGCGDPDPLPIEVGGGGGGPLIERLTQKIENRPKNGIPGSPPPPPARPIQFLGGGHCSGLVPISPLEL